MFRWRWVAAVALMAAVAACGAEDVSDPAPGINQGAADRQAALDEQARQTEQDYQDAMRNLNETLAVPGNGSYTIVKNGMIGEMWPGQWKTGDPGPAGPCTWILLSPTGDLIDNGAVRQGESGTMVAITEVGSVFQSFHCADWRRIGS